MIAAPYVAGDDLNDEDAARNGIAEHLARPRGQLVLEAAWTVHDVVNETMGAAVRMHVTERGGNPRQTTLVAFGGAGPLHACHLAAKLRVGLADDILSGDGEVNLTELSDEALIDLVRLDVTRATG